VLPLLLPASTTVVVVETVVGVEDTKETMKNRNAKKGFNRNMISD
jgi:phosphate/sulfate permease